MTQADLLLSSTLKVIKSHLPAIKEMDDLELNFVVSRTTRVHPAERTILDFRKASGTIDFQKLEEKLRLGHFGLELPEGWGDFLFHLALPLMTGLGAGAMTPEMLEITTKPLLLLLRVLILNSASEADDSIRPFAFRAQELYNILELMPKLRHGGQRLFSRMIGRIHTLTTWTPDESE
ncbi:hypothetical protein KP509_1Z297700 [Ceratopteris richardii]|nr:hypothetical protein KP509_1Z313000 [Ceratopteris richardii]KAH6554914.1 hypothetical protein KP509_1Z297700 [Ceratopteris richardii]